jgi:uncharacterized protein YqeY
MTLKEQLQSDLHDAMRARDEQRKSALRMVLASIQLAEAEQPEPLDDVSAVELIRKEVKRREEAVDMMREAGRDELVAEELAQLEILKAYLPAMMTDEEIRSLVEQAVTEIGASTPRDLGRVMGAVMPQVRGKADGRVVNQIVRDVLAA